MKLKLTVGERFALLGVLPQKADYVGLKSLRKARERLTLSDDEVKEFEFVTTTTPEGSNSTWNPKKDREVEIRLGEITYEMAKKALTELNQKRELTERQVTLYEKFKLSK